MRQKLLLFCTGAAGYCAIEILARGYTHWSMALTGGVCLMGMDRVTRRFGRASLLFCAVLSGLFVTGAELAVGLIVNIWLGWSVWDYSGETWNILGQICPRYTLYWCAISLPCCAVLTRLRRRAAHSVF